MFKNKTLTLDRDDKLGNNGQNFKGAMCKHVSYTLMRKNKTPIEIARTARFLSKIPNLISKESIRFFKLTKSREKNGEIVMIIKLKK